MQPRDEEDAADWFTRPFVNPEAAPLLPPTEQLVKRLRRSSPRTKLLGTLAALPVLAFLVVFGVWVVDDVASGNASSSSSSSAWDFELDLSKFDTVGSFINDSSHLSSTILPKSIKVSLAQDLIDSDLGAQAGEGYVAFCLSNGDYAADKIFASYVVVMSLTGEILNVRVGTPYELNGETYVSRFEGLKNYNSTTLMLARRVPTDATSGGDNYFILWNFVTGEEEVLPFGELGSHDIQHIPQSDSFVVFEGENSLSQYRHEDGKEMWHVRWETLCANKMHELHKTGVFHNNEKFKKEWVQACRGNAHFNRVQFVTDGTAYVSARNLDAVLKLQRTDLAGGENSTTIEWIMGGELGDWALVGEEGQAVEEGEFLWLHQHNAEILSNGDLMVFDNGIRKTSKGEVVKVHPSRVARAKMDETNRTVSLHWAVAVEENAFIYGDADLLPSGNVLATTWPDTVDPKTDGHQYEARVLEVAPGGRFAWSLGVEADTPFQQVASLMDQGFTESDAAVAAEQLWRGKDDEGHGAYLRANGEAPVGWAFYSAERFYSTPLVQHVKVDRKSSDKRVELSLKAWSAHRTSFSTDCVVEAISLPSGTVLARMTATLPSMWGAADITVPVLKSKLIDDDTEVEVRITDDSKQSTFYTLSASQFS